MTPWIVGDITHRGARLENRRSAHDEKIIPTFERIYHIRDGKTHEEAGDGRGIE